MDEKTLLLDVNGTPLAVVELICGVIALLLGQEEIELGFSALEDGYLLKWLKHLNC